MSDLPSRKAIDDVADAVRSIVGMVAQAQANAGRAAAGFFSQSFYDAALKSVEPISQSCMRALGNQFSSNSSENNNKAGVAAPRFGSSGE